MPQALAVRIAALTLSLLAAGPALADVDPAPQIGANAERRMLDNGLEIIVIPDHRAPVVTHMVWYRVGSADEPEGKSGIAHFLEHLMFKGTRSHPEGTFSRVIAELGGEENAFTSADYTAYFQRVAAEHLQTMMAYEADRMHNLILTEEVVAPERKVVLEERSMRVDGDPSAELSEALDATLYLRHPYGIPVIGWREEIEALTAADAIAFYDRYYTPNNAVLVVAGDVTADAVEAMARDTYGKVPRRADPPPRLRLDAEEIAVPRSLRHADEKVQQESVRIAWLVPSYNTAAPGVAEALDVLAEALGGGSTALLYRDLVIEKKLAASVGVYYRSDAIDDGQLIAYAVPRDGVTLEAMHGELLAAIDRALSESLNAEEVERAKRRLEASTIFAQDSQQAMARIFGANAATGGTLADVVDWPARIRAVELAAVQAVGAEFDPRTSVTGFLARAAEKPLP